MVDPCLSDIRGHFFPPWIIFKLPCLWEVVFICRDGAPFLPRFSPKQLADEVCALLSPNREKPWNKNRPISAMHTLWHAGYRDITQGWNFDMKDVIIDWVTAQWWPILGQMRGAAICGRGLEILPKGNQCWYHQLDKVLRQVFLFAGAGDIFCLFVCGTAHGYTDTIVRLTPTDSITGAWQDLWICFPVWSSGMAISGNSFLLLPVGQFH